jgi:ribonuclease HI
MQQEVEEFNKSLQSLVQKKTTYYAVAKGRTIGIYLSWEECSKHTNGYSNALFKKFDNFGDAKQFVLNNMDVKYE